MSDHPLHSGEFYSALCAVFWAVAVILFRVSGRVLPPMALNLFKNTLGFALVALTLLFMGPGWFPADQDAVAWITLLASGVLGIAVADTLFFASLNRLGAGRSAIVDCLYSPFVVLCAFVYLGEPLGFELVIAVLLMVGAILIGTYEPRQAGATSQRWDRETVEGVAMGAASMLLMAMGIVLAKPVLNTSSPLWATGVRFGGGMAFLLVQGALPRYRVQVRRAFTPSRDWRITLPAAFIGTYVAVILWTMGMAYTQTSVASVLNQMSALFVLPLAWLILKEPLGARQWIAIGMGVGAGALVSL